ncbi:hypothetical protein [Pseudoxanthomonas kaohsiungensis]|uniref:hypothetical protein n=1 Tax=Pseudoxanthomonas kaohsiungensis TaxID=283923 RepID=UPI0035B2747F
MSTPDQAFEVGRNGGRRIERVAIIPEWYGEVMSPCASIRLHAFAQHFPAEVRYQLPEELVRFRPDVVIWNRAALSTREAVDKMASTAQQLGASLIYDLDDNLLAMDEHPERDSYRGLIEAVAVSVARAGRVWCSTIPLRDALVSRGARAEWMPNALDPSMWTSSVPSIPRPAHHPGHVLQLLYMGTRTHDQDFLLLEEALSRVHRLRPGKFKLTLVGVAAAPLPSHDWLEHRVPPAHVGASYPAFVHWFIQQRDFDVGLAPLVDTLFNRSKSSIKVLDYAGIGLPTIASNVPAYALDMDGDRILVDNTPDRWADILVSAIDGKLPLASIASAASARASATAFEQGVRQRWISMQNSISGNERP